MTKRYLKDLIDNGTGQRIRWSGMGGAELEGVVLHRERTWVHVLFDCRDQPATVPAKEVSPLFTSNPGSRVTDALDCASAAAVDPFEPYPG